MTTYTQCRYLRRNGEQCTAEALDGSPDALIVLCMKHSSRVMQMIVDRKARLTRRSTS